MMSTQKPNLVSGKNSPFSQRFLIRLTIMSVVLLGTLLGLFSYLSFLDFEKTLAPELNSKAQLVEVKVARDISRAVGYGIPVSDLQGMQSYLGNILSGNPDIAAIEILSASASNAQVLHHAYLPDIDPSTISANLQRPPTPVIAKGQNVAEVRVSVRPGYIAQQLKELVYDIITAALIALLVAFEMISFFVHGRIFGPMQAIDAVLGEGASGRFTHTLHNRAIREVERVERKLNQCLYIIGERAWDVLEEAKELRAAQIKQASAEKVDALIDGFRSRFQTGEPYAFKDLTFGNIPAIRITLFVFMFAEELSRPFLPLLAAQYEAGNWLAQYPSLAGGITIAVFMAVLALSSLLVGGWVERFGPRRMFIMGVVPALLGYVGVFLAWDYGSFLLSRAVTGFGYAMVFVACQGYVMAHSSAETRAANLGVFVGAILVAGVAGPAIGGILANKIGYTATFLVSACMAGLSGVAIALILDRDESPHATAAAKTPAGKEGRRFPFALLKNQRFAAIAFLTAIPAKMALTGVIFLLVPLYLIDLGTSEASIGRVIMLYGVAVVALMPLAARQSDRSQAHGRSVILGGLITGIGGIALVLSGGGFWPMTFVVACIGLGQALSISPQLALVQNVIESDPNQIPTNAGMGLFRAIERTGNLAGPLVAGGLAAFLNIEWATMILTSVSLIGIILFLLLDRGAQNTRQGGRHAATP